MREQLIKLISAGKTNQAIHLLLEITNGTDLHNDVVIQSARYKDYEKNKDLGTSSFDQQKISLAKVNTALVSIVESLDINEDEHLELFKELEPKETIELPKANEKTIEKKNRKNMWKAITYVAVIIGILAGIAEFSGYSLRDIFKSKQVDSFSVTVLVHGKKGKDERILKKQGKVTLDIGADRKVEAIDAQGEATFKELPNGYADKMALISISHPQPYFPTHRNREYKLTPNKVIYLEVELTGLNKIKGRVIDKETENPLDSVRVSIENVDTITDKYGWFEMEIPENIQAKFVSVNFFKEGYVMEDLDSIAPHTNQPIGMSLKKK